MALFVRDKEVGGPENETNAPEEEVGARPARRFLTRTTASGRKKKEASLITAIHMMELNLDPDNAKFHEALLQEYLQDLEKEHNDFVMKELLDVNKEPQKS
jgi:hypothetical protein